MGFPRRKYWDFPGENGSHFLLQGIFLTQGSNAGLLHHRHILYHLSHEESLTLINFSQNHKHMKHMHSHFLHLLKITVWSISFAIRASLIAQLVKNLPVMQETLVRFLGGEDPLEKA